MSNANLYSEQAYLLWAYSQNQNIFKNEAKRRSYVKDIIGSYIPKNVMSKIAAKKSRSKPGKKTANSLFFTLENHKISALTPELRLYRADGDKITPFYFPVNTKFDEQALSGGGDLTSNANGIQDFSVKYQGTDLYTNSKYLSCELSLYVDSLQNILKEPPSGFARLADLFALRVTGRAKTRSGAASGQAPQSIEVVATLGYSILERDIFTDDEIAAITETFQIVRMNVSDHTINLNQDGTALINISYTARLESLGGNADNKKFFSATSTPVDIVNTAEMLTFVEGAKSIASSKQKRKQKQPKQNTGPKNITKQERNKQLKQVFFIAENLDGFGEVDINPGLFEKYIKFVDNKQAPNNSNNSTSIAPTPPLVQTGQFSEKLKQVYEETKKFHNMSDPIPFLYLGDLIEAFFIKTYSSMDQAIIEIPKIEKDKNKHAAIKKQIQKRQKALSKLKVLLPKITLTFNDIEREIGLSYLPISMPVVTSFLHDAYYNDGNVLNFTIDYLLKKINNILLTKIFEDSAVNKMLDGDHKFKSVNFSGAKLRLSSKGKINISDVSGPNASISPQDDQEYYVIYQTNEQNSPSPALTGRVKKDHQNGIYHFVPGQDRGLVKSINFAKFDVPFKRESLMTEQTNLYDELMMPYSANITMFGNNLFLPGSQIYIDPYSIGYGDPTDRNSAAVKLGFGGYYTILSVETNFSPGSLETSLECSFGSFPTTVTGLQTGNVQVTLRNKGIDEVLGADDSESTDTAAAVAAAPAAEQIPEEDIGLSPGLIPGTLNASAAKTRGEADSFSELIKIKG